MKIKLTILATLLLSFNTFAATTLNGIWSCQLQHKNSSGNISIFQNYFSIHSRTDGQVLFATLKESEAVSQNLFGYGLGTISGNTYTGSTKYATPFSLTIGADNNLTGAMQGLYTALSSTSILELNTKCIKVW